MITIDDSYVATDKVYIVDIFISWEFVKPWLYQTFGNQKFEKWELVDTGPDSCAISVHSSREDMLGTILLKWS